MTNDDGVHVPWSNMTIKTGQKLGMQLEQSRKISFWKTCTYILRHPEEVLRERILGWSSHNVHPFPHFHLPSIHLRRIKCRHEVDRRRGIVSYTTTKMIVAYCIKETDRQTDNFVCYILESPFDRPPFTDTFFSVLGSLLVFSTTFSFFSTLFPCIHCIQV